MKETEQDPLAAAAAAAVAASSGRLSMNQMLSMAKFAKMNQYDDDDDDDDNDDDDDDDDFDDDEFDSDGTRFLPETGGPIELDARLARELISRQPSIFGADSLNTQPGDNIEIKRVPGGGMMIIKTSRLKPTESFNSNTNSFARGKGFMPTTESDAKAEIERLSKQRDEMVNAKDNLFFV